MKRCLLILLVLVVAPAHSLSENAVNSILYLDKPYTITHLKEFNIDCVWTRGDNGYLYSEASGIDGPGLCFGQKAVEEAEKLDQEKKLTWHEPPSFDYEYGNKNKCYYKVDKEGGFVIQLFGDDNLSEEEINECRSKESQEKALRYAEKIEDKFEFAGFRATRKNLTGSVLLACYTGSLDRNDRIVSNEEQQRRFNGLLNLYKGDSHGTQRVTHAYNFARSNLSDRYPLDSRGQFRASVCDRMVMEGKL